MNAWRIRKWDDHFEVSQLRKVKKTLSWVAVPTKHDGRSFRRIARHEYAIEVYCAWQLMVQVAAKMPVRGLLMDSDGPLDADDLSDKTGFPADIFTKAFDVLTDKKINWLEQIEVDNAGSVLVARAANVSDGVLQDRTGQDITLHDRTMGYPRPTTNLFPELDRPEFQKAWDEYIDVRCTIKGKRFSVHAAELMLRDLNKWGLEKAVRSLEVSTRASYPDVYDPDERKGGNGSHNKIDTRTTDV